MAMSPISVKHPKVEVIGRLLGGKQAAGSARTRQRRSLWTPFVKKV